MSNEVDWDPIRDLAQRVLERGESLELTEDTRTLLVRTAQEVGIRQQDAEEALRNETIASTLLEETMKRINDGSDRLSDALLRMYDLRDKGDLEGACQQMRDVLAVEVVPLYRRQAEGMLEELTGLAAVSATGRVSADLPDRPQLAVLERRIQQGHALELTDDLRALLGRTAPTAGISKIETEEALKSPEGAEALMEMILSRFRDGKQRITRALFRMTSRRDAGDLEGARQQMRDVLAVEVVPQYRRMAEEQLRGLDRPPPEP
ncbi:DUSAM domain-containing protein [Archangium sp.]|uniref:DUSAM domain-containing protein n=1 Tax=Archangium sp. TaxID=1872627 RepID=UPI002D5B659B|nr:DUSAM domain-containing protein [Archangium sp.]HYO57036.1 DUSAM domain-containing protein [Archangium sp.]